MCTIAMLLDAQGNLVLAGNRDEMRTRKRALLPSPEGVSLDGARAIFPVDANAHGTWIGANAHHIAITLLNNYQDDARFTPSAHTTSRGLLVKELLALPTLDAIITHLRELDLTHTRPFVIAAGARAPAARAIQATWSGAALTIVEVALPFVLVSSSVELERADRARRAALAPLLRIEAPPSRDEILAAFAQHAPEPGPFTVSMAREDARTVSHTYIELSASHAHMIYLDGPPHEDPARHEVTLEMNAAPGAD